MIINNMIDKKYDICEYLKIEESDWANIQAILEFLIFWNKIENWKDNSFQYIIMDNYIKEIRDNNELNFIFLHFLKRYEIINWNNFDFDILLKEGAGKLEKERHKKLKTYLNDIKKSFNLKEKKDFVSYIIYRFRNRLFHWNKEIKEEQNDNFIVINNFLYYLENSYK